MITRLYGPYFQQFNEVHVEEALPSPPKSQPPNSPEPHPERNPSVVGALEAPTPMASATAAAAFFSAAGPSLQGFAKASSDSSLAPAPGVLRLPAKLPSGFPRFPFRLQGYTSSFASDPNFWHKWLRMPAPGVVYATAATEKSIYDFTVKDIDGKDISLSKFKGKVLLIVNVASKCGLTTSNYTELSHIYEKYKAQGLEILAFPCNQFGGQEPGANPEIKQFACTRFKAEFPIFNKVDVNGPNTAPVYKFLKSQAGGFLGDVIKWNFEKFLLDKNGKVVERYPPTTSPFQIERDIKKLLAA